jgi:hypothetical protein
VVLAVLVQHLLLVAELQHITQVAVAAVVNVAGAGGNGGSGGWCCLATEMPR